MGGEGLLNEHIAMQRVATVGLPGFELVESYLFLLCLEKKNWRECQLFSGDFFITEK